MKRIAQLGLVSKGVVYVLFGLLLILAVYVPSEEPVGLVETIKYVISLGWAGRLSVFVMAVGLMCYSAWKFFQIYFNVEGYPNNWHGYFIRFTWVGPLFFHLVLGVYAFVQLYGWYFSTFRYFQGQRSQLQGLLFTSWGKWVIGLLALGLISNAISLIYLAFTGKYKIMLTGQRSLLSSPRIVGLMGQTGYYGYGLILLLTGILFSLAIYYSDSSLANGQISLFYSLIAQPFGKILTTFIALGAINYGLFFLWASYSRWNAKLQLKSVEENTED